MSKFRLLTNTQQNFLNFKHDTKSTAIHGFNSNGVVVLTNNANLFNLLHIIQFQKMNNTAISLIYDLSLAEILINETQNPQFTNSIYFKQEDCAIDDENGSTKILILADNEQKLKEFTRIIIKYHKDFCINNFDMSDTSNQLDKIKSHAPRLEFFITIKNAHSNVKFRNPSKAEPRVFDAEPGYDNILLNHLDISSNVNLVNNSIDKLSSQAKIL